jgi:activator of HSP90 ATPase
MAIDFELREFFSEKPAVLYAAWLDAGEHARMTGSPATVSGEVGDAFQAWDGYIEGRNLELEPGRRILQSWRTTEFSDSDEDSLLEILFEAEGAGTWVTLRHSNLPEHGMQYHQGWKDSYFTPMKAYFEGK